MPELPEVETVRRGIFPLIQQTVIQIIIRNPKLRWPIPSYLPEKLIGSSVLDIQRRGKYLLFSLTTGALILHLGMSGRIHLLKDPPPASRHDHVDIMFTDQWTLRYTDTRRFGCLLWTEQPPAEHPLLAHLGPEPLSDLFTGNYLFKQAQGRKIPVKSFIMDSRIVVGIGNIYANEALFKAKISPLTPAGDVSKANYQRLAQASKHVLEQAIQAGGSTINDFQNARGEPGYFSQQLSVYGRENQPCHHCQNRLVKLTINQRTTIYCPQCQIT